MPKTRRNIKTINMPKAITPPAPPMTPPTMGQQVLNAVTKALEFMGQINEAKTEIMKAKQGMDAVRLNNQVPTIMEATAAKNKATAESTKAQFDKIIAEAAKPLEAAQTVFNRITAEADGKRNAAIQNVEQEGVTMIAQARQNQELLIATAQAEIHTAEQKLLGIQALLEQYRRQIQQQLGIDINALIAAASK